MAINAISSLTNGFFTAFPEVSSGGGVILQSAGGQLEDKKRGKIKVKGVVSIDIEDKSKITVHSFDGVDFA